MLITTHIAVTVWLGKGLGLQVPEMIVALAGGVLVDIDHLFKPGWRKTFLEFIKTGQRMNNQNHHSWIQELLPGLVVGSLIGLLINLTYPDIRWWILPLFQAIHIFLDYLMKNAHQPFVPFSKWGFRGFIPNNSKIELILSVLALGLLLI